MHRYQPYSSSKRSYNPILMDQDTLQPPRGPEQSLESDRSYSYMTADHPTQLLSAKDHQLSTPVFRCRNRDLHEDPHTNSHSTALHYLDNHSSTRQELYPNMMVVDSGSHTGSNMSHVHGHDPFSFPVPLPHEMTDHSNCAQSFIRRRNERERERVRCVNQGYDSLRKCLPLPSRDKRISKVEILRSAIRYIDTLQDLLGRGGQEGSMSCSSSSEKVKIESNENFSSSHKKISSR